MTNNEIEIVPIFPDNFMDFLSFYDFTFINNLP